MVLAVTFLILLFVGRLLVKLVVTVSQLEGLSGVTGVVSLLLLSRGGSLLILLCPTVGSSLTRALQRNDMEKNLNVFLFPLVACVYN